MICLVTDRRRLSCGPSGADRLVELVGAAAHAGVSLVQVRERDLEARELTSLVRRCLDAVSGTEAKVLVNDRSDVALAAGSHGVHLRADSVEAERVRRLLGAGALVGRSVHSADEASKVSQAGGVDYLILGTMFQTRSKGSLHPLLTVDDLSAAVQRSSAPVLAIGGMTMDRAAAVARTGAAGIAAIDLFIPPASRSPELYLETIITDLRRLFRPCGAPS